VKALPFIGPVREFTGDVLAFLTKSRAAYGEAFRIRMFGIEMTCLCGSDAIALLEDNTYLRTGKSMHVLDEALQSRLPSTFDGPQHSMFRKIHFQFLNRRLESQRREDIQKCLARHTDRWQAGRQLDVLREAQTQTVDVLSNLLNGEPFPFSGKDLARVVHTLIGATYGHVPKWLALGNPFYRATQKRMRTHLLELVARVRANPELAASTLVGQYLDFPPPTGVERWEDDDLVAVPYGAYLAGFDTVASAASFLLYQLLRHPDFLAQVRQEHTELARESSGSVDPMKQVLLRAAFLETVRLNPPGALVIRYAERDFEFSGFTIRNGDEVLVVIASHHMNDELFPRPHEFEPTRFLGGTEQAIILKRHVLAFGSGNHRCTGAMIGELMAVEIVSTWVNQFDLALVPAGQRPRVVARPFTQPLGLRVKVLGRRSSAATGGKEEKPVIRVGLLGASPCPDARSP
jgi:cytochrome P450